MRCGRKEGRKNFKSRIMEDTRERGLLDTVGLINI